MQYVYIVIIPLNSTVTQCQLTLLTHVGVPIILQVAVMAIAIVLVPTIKCGDACTCHVLNEWGGSSVHVTINSFIDKPLTTNHAGDRGKSVDVYFPQGKWYDWYTHQVVSANGGETKTVYTPIYMIPVCFISSVQLRHEILCQYYCMCMWAHSRSTGACIVFIIMKLQFKYWLL